ncbi:MAG: CRTAC1 family protein [Acidobacteria bacterium]|nr:CRTAC1 family protein [Acidobacteriota bacterium]
MASRGAVAAPKPKASGKAFPVSFTDVAIAAGLRQPLVSGGVRSKYVVEAMGTGVGFLDSDNDGWVDIFLVNGSRFEAGPKATSLLYRNKGDGTFLDVTKKAGITKTGWGQSVAVADYDNDGAADLFVTYWGQNVLYRNRGDGTFADVTAQAGLQHEGARWGSGASFFDYDRDGDVDLFVANYLTLELEKTAPPGKDSTCRWLGVPVFCGPRGLPFAGNFLYRNNGDGTFTDVSDASGIGAAQKTYALGVLAADLDGDAWPDLYVACDSTRSLFYHNNGDGTFVERGTYIGLAYDDNGMEQAGMGLALGDYDGDGLLDIAKTNFADDYPNLYHNRGKGGYMDRALQAGLGIHPQYVLWSALFADFDNDAWPDLFFSAGHVFSEVDALQTVQRYRNPRLLYRNLGGGKFEDVGPVAGPGIAAMHSSRGAAAGDFDNDGDEDLLIMNRNAPVSLLRNDNRSGHHWLKVKLVGTKSNRMAIGAQVRVRVGERVLTNVVLSQSGYYSVNDARLHFGLGSAALAETVEVRWPSGASETWRKVKADQVVELKEGAGQ